MIQLASGEYLEMRSDEVTERRPRSTESTCKWIRVGGWLIAVALGAAQAWALRFTMNPDGVSYLDIGDAFWRGDFRMAINAWWSPVYPLILGFFVKVLKPNAYWEYPVAHLVNLFIYIAALACFEFFLTTFIGMQSSDKNSAPKVLALSQWEWRLLGYTVFVCTSLQMITLGVVTPDLCVAAFAYLSFAILLKIRQSVVSRKTLIAFGLVLGLGYLAKAVMFPIGLVFLATAVLACGKSWERRKQLLISAAVFFVVSVPLICLLSVRKARLTFGDSGRIDYAVFVDGVDVFIPTGTGLKHPVQKISASPPAYQYAMAGSQMQTYSLWYDPSYWHEGIAPRFRLSGQLHSIKLAFLWYGALLFNPFLQLNVTVALLGLYLLSPRLFECFKRVAQYWPLLIAGFFPLCLYSLVVVEYRFLGAFVCFLWIAAFRGVSLSYSRGFGRFLAVVVILIALSTVGLCIRSNVIHGMRSKQCVMYSEAAEALAEYGIRPGDQLAVIADEPFGEGGAFVARLARAQIIAEVRNPELFWKANPTDRSRVLSGFARAGAKVTLLYENIPDNSLLKPQRLGSTPYYVSFGFSRSDYAH